MFYEIIFLSKIRENIYKFKIIFFLTFYESEN